MATYTKPTKRFTVSRTLHCIDAENLSGAPLVSAQRLAATYASYRKQVDVGPFDQTIVASSHFNALAVGTSWPEGQFKWRSGKDGADIELITAVKAQIEQSKFDHVVIASGDGIFGELVWWLTEKKIRVTVVGIPGSISHVLRLVADEVVVLNGHHTRTYGMGA
jgi:uncharacterized LabA/DUF88 family protein